MVCAGAWKEILAPLCHASTRQDRPVSPPSQCEENDAENCGRFSESIMLTFFNLEQDWIISELTPTETCANERSSAAVLPTIPAR
ncbi:hypothetical protein ELH26_33075 (plasmid) [Rhizobium leguminosarum]|nr:hypothetical protein ELH26_33075 [Rhizobium leguminosarum]